MGRSWIFGGGSSRRSLGVCLHGGPRRVFVSRHRRRSTGTGAGARRDRSSPTAGTSWMRMLWWRRPRIDVCTGFGCFWLARAEADIGLLQSSTDRRDDEDGAGISEKIIGKGAVPGLHIPPWVGLLSWAVAGSSSHRSRRRNPVAALSLASRHYLAIFNRMRKLLRRRPGLN